MVRIGAAEKTKGKLFFGTRFSINRQPVTGFGQKESEAVHPRMSMLIATRNFRLGRGGETAPYSVNGNYFWQTL
jgi:hypothetical protein